MNEIIIERLKENKDLFSEQELKIIDNNINIVRKIYLLGLINAKEVYAKD